MHKKTIQPDDRQLDKLIAARSLLPCMSNHKWVKLLDALVAHAAEEQECRVKLLWELDGQVRHLLFNEDTSFGFNYYHEAMEAMVTGQPKGWYAYREIEWLDFPRMATRRESRQPIPVVQDLEALQTILDGLGKFYTYLDADILRVYCYLKPAEMQGS